VILISRTIVLGCTDRALRTLAVHPLTGLLNPIHRYQDMVNRTPWNAIGFSGDGEYVMGGAAHKMAHNVFIWDKSFGTLVKVLEGPRESLAHCDVSCADGTAEPMKVMSVAPNSTRHRVRGPLRGHTPLADQDARQLGGVRAGLRGAGGEHRVRRAGGRI